MSNDLYSHSDLPASRDIYEENSPTGSLASAIWTGKRGVEGTYRRRSVGKASASFPAVPLGIATAIGALDGLAASADQNAGRSLNFGGIIGFKGYCWAAGVQTAAALGGTLFYRNEWARAPMFMGWGLMARGAMLRLAQNGKGRLIQG